jgi:hypothetical protein
LDIVGLNHYHNSQWEVPSQKRLEWHLRDPRRIPLADMLNDVWQRYGRPVVVAETGHVGVGRAAWVSEIAGEARRARAQGVPLQGICLYPLLDRPDWNDTRQWHRSGLWHLPCSETRSLNRPYARALLSWRNTDMPNSPAEKADVCLLVLLPCAWEDWRAPRDLLLASLGQVGRVFLIEPPRPSQHLTTVRVHSLSPSVDLVILHGREAAGWAAPPSSAQLDLLRSTIAPFQRRFCWGPGWAADGHAAWLSELGGRALFPPPTVSALPVPEMFQHSDTIVPSVGPLVGRRRRSTRSYENDEIDLLLGDIPGPRTWLVAPSSNSSFEQFKARLLPLALQRPDVQWLIDAPSPESNEAWPINTHWLGRVHDSLHESLANNVQQVVPWRDHAGWMSTADDTSSTAAARDDFLTLLHHVIDLCAGDETDDRHGMPITEQKRAVR